MKLKKGLAFRAFMTAVFVVLSTQFVSAAIPPAGSLISNQSWANYAAGTSMEMSVSNVVTSRVLPVYAIQLTPVGTVAAPAYSLTGAGGDTLYCSFDLTNLGNAHDSVVVDYRHVPPSNTNISDMVFFDDANGNGVLDAGEDDPSFLAFEQGEVIVMDAAVILPPGQFGGRAYLEISAVSAFDTLSVPQTTVIRVVNTDAPQMTLFLGPGGNARALPGGEGSSDDLTVGMLDYSDQVYVFDNDVFNEGPLVDVFEVTLADTTGLPRGLAVAFADSAGRLMPRSPGNPAAFLIGSLAPGETLPIRVELRSSDGPLCRHFSSPLSLPIRARSVADTLQQNFTVDRLVPPQSFNPLAALSLSQAFHEPTASLGDVVTFLVTAENITDSLRIDNISVFEWNQPQLDFLSSPQFVWDRGRLVWPVGTLAGGESKTAVIKFVVNGRVFQGKAKVVGNISGTAETGDRVSAGPVISSLAINNDIFSAEGLVFGEVYVDGNGNNRREEVEEGIPGAAVFLDSGEYAVTDSLGRFSLPRTFAGYRTVRLDDSSLPSDVEFFEATEGWDGPRRGNERLIHLLPAGHVKVTFPLKRKPPPPVEVSHSIMCQEKVSISKQKRLYKAMTLPSSHFAFGRAVLMPGSEETLRPIVEFLMPHAEWGVFLEGHTDSIPINTKEFPSNMELSIARTEAVKTFLVGQGIDKNRIFTRGYGDRKPIYSNETIDGRRYNRRVEVSFIPPGVTLDRDTDVRAMRTTVRNLGALPDTFHVKIFWEVATTSPEPVADRLVVSLPEQFLRPEVSVRLGSRPVVPVDGAYRLDGFARSANVRCEIGFLASSADTALVDDVKAVIETNVSDKAEAPAPANPGEIPHTIVLKPYQGGRSTETTRQFNLATWKQLVPPGTVSPVGTPTSAPPDSVTGGYSEHHNPGEPGTSASFGGREKGGRPEGPAFGRGRTGVDSPATLVMMEPGDGEVFSRKDQIVVRARMPVGGKPVLSVDGREVSELQMGERMVDAGRGFEEIAWYGVRIRSGWNTVLLRSRLLDGTELIDSVKVALAGRPASLEAVRGRVMLRADGHSTEIVRFSLKDNLGLPVVDGTVATIAEGDTLVANADARPTVPGIQVTSLGGYFVLTTRTTRETGRGKLVLRCESLEAACEIVYLPADRPMFATGLVDVKLGVYDKRGAGDPLGLQDFDDGFTLKSTSRLFVQSPMAHGINLTARLDTRKRYDDPLLKEDNPEKQYPIYGDASEVHYAAPSRGGNYVSLDKGESYVRYGDFRTPLKGGEFLSYHRAANGLSTALINGNNSFKSFLTKTDFATLKDEMRADGTSGFYHLSRAPVVENSERIFLETRDRYQLENVIEVKPLVRNRDYTINHFDGSILFKEAVAATDRDFNPVYIVAIYEVDTEDESQYLYGVRGDVAESKSYRVGAAAVARSGDGERYALFGLDGEVKAAGVVFGGELARSDDGAAGAGNAVKIEAGFKNNLTDHSLYVRRVDGGFSNPSFRGSSHELASIKSGFKSMLRISNEITVEADGFLHELDRTEERKANVRTCVRYKYTYFNFLCGMRVAEHEEQDHKDSGVLSLLGISAGSRKFMEFETQWEKNLGSESVEDYPDRLKSSVSVPFRNRYKLVAAHEYLTASGRGGSHQVSAGVESRLFSSTTAYTKYSMDRTAGEGRMGAVAGLKQSVRISKELAGTFAVENFFSLSDQENEEYFSAKTGLSYRRPRLHMAEGQYEYRWQKSRTKHLLRVNASKQLRNGFSALLKDVLAYSPENEGDDALSYHGRLGLVYRPLALPVTSLLLVKNSYERYTPVNPGAVTWKLVLATDVNVTPAPLHEVRFKYAFKHVEDYSYGISLSTNADLVLSQYVYHFADCWDVDLWGKVLRLRGGGTIELGTGVEVGRLFLRCLRVGAGYSVGGFEDPDFSGTDAWSSGFGIRAQLILSEWVLREFGGGFYKEQ